MDAIRNGNNVENSPLRKEKAVGPVFPSFLLKFLPSKLRARLSPHWWQGFYLTEVFAEVIFLAFIILALGGLIARREGAWAAVGYAVLYTIFWVTWSGLVRWGSQRSGLVAYVRGFGPWIAVMLSYNLVGKLIRLIHPAIYDDQLQHLSDHFGMSPTGGEYGFLEGRPALVDLFSLFYLGLFAWLFSFLFYYSLRRRPLYHGLMLGLMMIYAVGFMGYLLYPAQGPLYNHPEQWLWLKGGWAFHLMNRIVSHMGAKFDVFPSLHAAIVFYLFGWQWTQHHPLHRLWAVPLVLGILVSTMVLGFHYLPDLIGGGLLGGAAFILSQWGEIKFSKWVETPVAGFS
jgi:hypothetical protein